MSTIDPGKIFSDAIAAANAAVSGDITKMGGYAEAKLRAMAKQASMIGTYYASKLIDDSDLPHFLDGLEDMATSFLRTLVGLIRIQIEKAWNAIVGVLWGAIEAATGGVLQLAKPGA